ncbi:MAG: aminomethyl-transferring glycine dehydrogenase subunit GcvPA [Clostridiales bacterium]|jgi:glycine dehydrogenase subunit 1|nr:aminomethyl-transferring glycine dehydrogenase subunit GcvPA [Clostridiales bacterium]
MGSYLPSTRQEQQEMLEAIGLNSLRDLYTGDVPASVLLDDSVNIPKGLAEMVVRAKMERIASKNKVFSTVLRGAGSYDHYIPAIVSTVTSKEEFVTTYTPYQAEISQGVLQSIFEYQTMMCELTGMDVSNASVYDGASAAAEAVMMTQTRSRSKIYVASTAHPEVIQTIKTYCWGRDVAFEEIPQKDGLLDLAALENLPQDTACVYLQQPNFFGLFEEAETVAKLAHDAGAKAVMGFYPISLGICKTPAEQGFDIAVAEGQSLGIPMSWGGPYLGIMTAKKDMMRMLPGRIAGETKDSKGRRAFVLTLQAREQHIRREKASSNVCTNQALCAMTAAVYLAAMGPAGLSEVAQLCYEGAHYFADELSKLKGFDRVHKAEFFNEFLTNCPMDVHAFEKEMAKRGILCGLTVDNHLLWCVTEKMDKLAIDEVINVIKEVCGQ